MMSQPSGFLREMAKAGTDDTVMVAYFARRVRRKNPAVLFAWV